MNKNSQDSVEHLDDTCWKCSYTFSFYIVLFVSSSSSIVI